MPVPGPPEIMMVRDPKTACMKCSAKVVRIKSASDLSQPRTWSNVFTPPCSTMCAHAGAATWKAALMKVAFLGKVPIWCRKCCRAGICCSRESQNATASLALGTHAPVISCLIPKYRSTSKCSVAPACAWLNLRNAPGCRLRRAVGGGIGKGVASALGCGGRTNAGCV